LAQEVAAATEPVDEAKVDLLSKYAHLLPTQDPDTDWRQKLAYDPSFLQSAVVVPQSELPEMKKPREEPEPVEQPVPEPEPALKLPSSPLKPLRHVASVEAASVEVRSILRRQPLREILTASASQAPVTPVVKLVLNEITSTAPSAPAGSPGKQEKVLGKPKAFPALFVVDPVDAKFEAQWTKMENSIETWQAVSAAEGTDATFRTEQAFRTARTQVQLLSSVSESSLEKGADAAELSAAMVRVKFAAHTLGREMSHLEQTYGACERDRGLLQVEVARAHKTEANLREQVAALKAQLSQVA